jgi:creatinine amidohydrolase
MQLQMQTWNEVEAYLERSSTIIMPIGSTEQHGPNGLIGTDALTAQHIATDAGEQAGILVAPTIAVGMAQHHMAFKGSMTLRPSTLILVIREYVESLAHHGFDRFFFVNGHGGNIATISAAFQEIYGASTLAKGDNGNRGAVKCKLRNWWDGSEAKALISKEFGKKDGSHATISEVAMTQHLFPEHIKQVPDMGPPSDARGPWTDAANYRAKFPDGRIGSHPYLATPEVGRKLFEIAVKEVANDAAAFAAA